MSSKTLTYLCTLFLFIALTDGLPEKQTAETPTFPSLEESVSALWKEVQELKNVLRHHIGGSSLTASQGEEIGTDGLHYAHGPPELYHSHPQQFYNDFHHHDDNYHDDHQHDNHHYDNYHHDNHHHDEHHHDDHHHDNHYHDDHLHNNHHHDNHLHDHHHYDDNHHQDNRHHDNHEHVNMHQHIHNDTSDNDTSVTENQPNHVEHPSEEDEESNEDQSQEEEPNKEYNQEEKSEQTEQQNRNEIHHPYPHLMNQHPGYHTPHAHHDHHQYHHAHHHHKPRREAHCHLHSNSGYPERSNVTGLIVIHENRDTQKTLSLQVHIKGFNTVGTKHGFHIHENEVIDNDCSTAGGHFNPFGTQHAAPNNKDRHVGDLGNIVTNKNGEVHVAISDRLAKFDEIAGKSFVVHELEDDLGLRNDSGSLTTGNAGSRLACCNIVLLEDEKKSVQVESTTMGVIESRIRFNG